MESLLFTVILFLFITGIQSLVHRVLFTRSIVTMKSVLVHALGYIILIILSESGRLSLPISSFVLYTLMWLVLSEFYLGLVLGGETPAAMILSSFKTKNGQTEKQLQKLFTTKRLIWKRVDDLIAAGYVNKKKNIYRVTQKGKILETFIDVYQTIFNRKVSG